MLIETGKTKAKAKPFLKWAGGKRQLIEELEASLPEEIKKSKNIDNYVEPFLGGGAFFFFLEKNYNVKKSVICDINKEIMIAYKVIKKEPEILIDKLQKMEDKYLNLNQDQRKNIYYEKRKKYNKQRFDFNYNKYDKSWILRASFLIFLNKTCFNGLFRQNNNGKFNVPIGRYKNPTICDTENILAVNKVLKDTKILIGDFEETAKYIDQNSLVYFDPPYRPISSSSSFTKYSKGDFNDEDQKRLARFYKNMDKKGASLILSNSDPKNENPNDNFFDELYSGFNIRRVGAKRSINSNGNDRGKVKELVITNYEK